MNDVGVWIGILGALIGAGGIYYGRRQAIAAEGPKDPKLSLGVIEWETGDWLRLTVMTTNQTDSSWAMTSALLTTPAGGKLISEHERPNAGEPWEPKFASLEEINPELLSNSANPLSKVAAAGTRSSQNFYGMNDACREDFFAYIPPRLRAEVISIVFTLEDNALTTRQSSTTLNRRLPNRSSNPTN